MERKIGEQIKYKGKTYVVTENIVPGYCLYCDFVGICNEIHISLKGSCCKETRRDKKDIIFKEVTND